MLGWHEDRLARRQQCFQVTLQVEEVDRALLGAPLRWICRAEGQARHAHRLVDAGHAQVAVGHAGITPGHAPQLEHPHPRRLAAA